MKINENLRSARLEQGLTQEQVAQRVGITRQALSHYESGRSQPDIDMLLSLCRVYNTDINDILYGRKKSEKALTAVKIIALVLGVAVFLLSFASAFMLSYADMFYPVSEGQVHTDEMMNLLVKVSLWDKIKVADAVNVVLSFWGYAGLMAVVLATKTYLQASRKLIYAGIVTASVLGAGALFALINPSDVYTLQEYITTPLRVCIRLWVILAADLIAEYLILKNKRRKTENL